VILMDINLPGISGFGCLKILQDDKNTAHIPVLALSANAVPRDIEKGIEAGFFRYLTKPINVVEFMDALDVALHYAAAHGLAGPEDEHGLPAPAFATEGAADVAAVAVTAAAIKEEASHD
jgi:DNA-binding response OmpR family regulator